MFDFLKSVGNAKNQQIAADPRRLITIQAAPLAPQLIEARVSADELRSSR